MADQGDAVAPVLLHADQRPGVDGPGLHTELPDHRLVAGQLQVPVGQDVHHPHQGVPPVEAQRRRQDQFRRPVQPPDVDVLVGQHIGHGLLVGPVGGLGHQDHRAEQAVGEGRGDPVALADGQGPPQPVAVQPPRREGGLHWQGGAKLPAAPPVDHGQGQSQKDRPGGPDQGPGGEGGGGGGRLRPGGGLARRNQGQELKAGGGLGGRIHRLRPQQGVHAEGGGQGEGEQQPGQGHAPEDQEGAFWKPLQGQGPDDGDGQDHDCPGGAHLQ